MIPSDPHRTITDPPLRTVASELMNKLGPTMALKVAREEATKSPRARRFWMRVARAIER
jgi:hypothetical protein